MLKGAICHALNEKIVASSIILKNKHRDEWGEPWIRDKLTLNFILFLNATFSGRARNREVPVVKRCLFSHLHSPFKLNAFAECVSPKSLRESDMLLHGKTKIESGWQRFCSQGFYLLVDNLRLIFNPLPVSFFTVPFTCWLHPWTNQSLLNAWWILLFKIGWKKTHTSRMEVFIIATIKYLHSTDLVS